MQENPAFTKEALHRIRDQTTKICMFAVRHNSQAFSQIRSLKTKRTVAHLVIADKLMALRAVGLSAMATVDVCEQLRLFERRPGDSYLPLTLSDFWSLAKLIKHGKIKHTAS